MFTAVAGGVRSNFQFSEWVRVHLFLLHFCAIWRERVNGRTNANKMLLNFCFVLVARLSVFCCCWSMIAAKKIIACIVFSVRHFKGSTKVSIRKNKLKRTTTCSFSLFKMKASSSGPFIRPHSPYTNDIRVFSYSECSKRSCAESINEQNLNYYVWPVLCLFCEKHSLKMIFRQSFVRFSFFRSRLFVRVSMANVIQ